jgi:hypothetical protein
VGSPADLDHLTGPLVMAAARKCLIDPQQTQAGDCSGKGASANSPQGRTIRVCIFSALL